MNQISLLYPNDRAHCHRTAALSRLLARLFGYSEEEARTIYQAALLHDIGKIAIPVSILNKSAVLTNEEREIIQTHVSIGADMLAHGDSSIRFAVMVALQHHERMDGSGYLGLRGRDIHPYAKLVAVADVFDALISPRSYKSAWNIDRVCTYLNERSGEQFDADIVHILLTNLNYVLMLYPAQAPYLSENTCSVCA